MNDWLVGIACCLIAGLFFGTNYLPLKSVDCGDGFYFSLQMSFGICLVGILVVMSPLVRGGFDGSDSPWGMGLIDIYPLAAVGGAAWMIGNLLVPTIIRRVGLGLGLTIWDLSNMLTGWASGRFGLLGVWREEVNSVALNTSGVVLCVCSLFFFVAAGRADSHREGEHQADIAEVMCPTCLDVSAPEVSASREANSQDPQVPRADARDVASAPASAKLEGSGAVHAGDVSDESAKGAPARFAVGLVLALLAGVLFGYTFDLPTMLMQCGLLERGREDGEERPIDGFCRSWVSRSLAGSSTRSSPFAMTYVFSHFCGIALTGIGAFAAYAACMGRTAYAPRELILPSMSSGVMWGVAQSAWFLANEKLSLSVAFPIISTLPGLVALACGYLFFGELASVQSRRLALVGVSIRIPAVVMIALS